MDKKNIVFIVILLAIVFIFFNPEFTGYTIYRVPLNIDVDLDEDNEVIKAGDEIEANIIFYNLFESTQLDFNYSIKKLGFEEVFVSKGEQLLLEEELAIKRTLRVPNNLEGGYYSFKVNAMNNTIQSNALFRVVGKSNKIKNVILAILGTITIIALILTVSILVLTRGKAISQASEGERMKLKLFFWTLNWKLKHHHYYVKYLIGLLIVFLIATIIVLIYF